MKVSYWTDIEMEFVKFSIVSNLLINSNSLINNYLLNIYLRLSHD